jgi:hypothetical protein
MPDFRNSIDLNTTRLLPTHMRTLKHSLSKETQIKNIEVSQTLDRLDDYEKYNT